MQQHELIEFILDAFTELATLHAAAAAAAERVWSVLAKYGDADFQEVFGGSIRPECLPHDRLVVSPTTFSVQWRNRRCDLGPSILFKLIQRLSRRPGRYFTHDLLMQDVWERHCSHTAVRSAVKRLRRALCDAGMPELAAAIRGRRECYGLFLDENAS